MIYQTRSNFSFAYSFCMATMVVLLAFFCGNGCGGGSSKKSPPPAPAPETPEVTDAEAEKEKQAEKKPPKKKKKKPKTEDVEEEPVEKPLPEDLSLWTREDFLRAKAMKKEDTKYDLTPALAALGSRNHGMDAADEDAEILLALLAMELPPDFDAEIAAAEAKKAEEEAEAAKKKPVKKKRKNAEDEEQDEDATEEEEEAEEESGEPAEEPEEEMRPEQMPALEITLVVLSQAEVKAGVTALLENDSPAAKQGTLDVLAGKVRTDGDRDAIQAILEGISDAGTPETQKLLFRILTHAESFRQPQTEEQKAALNVLLQGGKERKTAEGRSVNVRTAGGSRNLSDITAQEMRSFIFNRMRDRFSPEFRKEIALFLVKPQVDAALLRERDYQQFLENMLKYVMEKKPENLDAQLALYLQPALDADQKLKLEENLLPLLADVMRAEFLLVPQQTAELALDMRREKAGAVEDEDEDEESSGEKTAGGGWSLLGGGKKTETSPRGGSGGTRKTDDVAFVAQLLADDAMKTDYARQLWSDAMIKIELARLPEEFKKLMKKTAGEPKLTAADFRAPPTSSRALEMLMLTPRGVSRKAVSRILTRGWDLGPAVMTQAGVLGNSEKEPGFLMVLKSLERRDPPKAKTGSASSRSGDKKPSATQLKKEALAKTAGEWMKTTETQVKQWCDQFAQAALNQAALENADTGEDKRADFPLPLPDGVELTAKYTLEHRPDGVSRAGEGLKIHFVRFTYTSRWSLAISNFRRAHKGVVQRETDASDNPRLTAVWLERYRADDETKTCQSLDILLTPVGGDTVDLKSTAQEEIQVDILVMEMDDLRDAAEKKAAEKPAEASAEEASPGE